MKTGPTLADVKRGGSRLVTRHNAGMEGKQAEVGHSTIQIVCPFCAASLTVTAAVLSMGGGRCECGALCAPDGKFHQFKEKVT